MLSFLLSYLLLYKYVTLFVVMYLSGLFIPIPVNSMLFAGGVFASQGYLGIVASFSVALIGNVAGDATGYLLTRVWKHKYVKQEHLERIPYIWRLENAIRKYARVTIFATRFLGIAGSGVNFLSGLSDVPWPRFFIFDILGNAISITIFLLGGYVLGTYSEDFTEAMSLIGWMIAITFVLALLVNFIRKKPVPIAQEVEVEK